MPECCRDTVMQFRRDRAGGYGKIYPIHQFQCNEPLTPKKCRFGLALACRRFGDHEVIERVGQNGVLQGAWCASCENIA